MADVSIASIIESVTLSEVLTMHEVLQPQLTEGVTLAEVLSLFAPLLATPTADTVTLSEALVDFNLSLGVDRLTEHFGSRHVRLLDTLLTEPVTAAKSTPVESVSRITTLAVVARFRYGSGGTSAQFWVQTSVDGGCTWYDLVCFAFATQGVTKLATVAAIANVSPSVVVAEGGLADDQIAFLPIGDHLRVRYTITGTYAGETRIVLDAVLKE